jgi:hypothetical protein
MTTERCADGIDKLLSLTAPTATKAADPMILAEGINVDLPPSAHAAHDPGHQRNLVAMRSVAL